MIPIREMTIADHPAVVALLSDTPGTRLRDADSRDATARYLNRNPGLSFVAEINGDIVGCVMCGHDGRRGYLQHLAVHGSYRRQGIGSRLVLACVSRLQKLRILKTHIDVLVSNEDAIQFWKRLGWQKRDDIYRFSLIASDGENV